MFCFVFFKHLIIYIPVTEKILTPMIAFPSLPEENKHAEGHFSTNISLLLLFAKIRENIYFVSAAKKIFHSFRFLLCKNQCCSYVSYVMVLCNLIAK